MFFDGFINQAGDFGQLAGAGDDIYTIMFEQFFPHPLSHTADNSDQQGGVSLFKVLDMSQMRQDPVFGVLVPDAVPDVPSNILRPRDTWADKAAYDAQAKKLAELFRKNFEKYAPTVPESVRNAGPKA